ncbi:MAG: hypothetical protein ACLQED_07420 [Desulfobaccales bacterium]
MVQFAQQDWLAQHRRQSKGRLKRAAYFFLRPLYSRRYSVFLAPETLSEYRPRWVLGPRGIPPEAHRVGVDAAFGGVPYLQQDLFSRPTTREYLACYREAGFVVQDLILELSRQALTFRKRFPGEFREIAESNAGRCAPDDLLIKAHLLILQKPGEAQ